MAQADAHPYEDDVSALLIEASFDLLAAGGWADFSLRAVAEAIGAAGSAASHRFGDRAGLITAMGEECLRREALGMADFLPGVQLDTPGRLVSVLSAWQARRCAYDRRQARVFAELLLVAHYDGGLQSLGARSRDLGVRMIRRLCPAVAPELAWRLTGLLMAESAFALLLGDDAIYSLESEETLERAMRLASGAAGGLPVYWLAQSPAAPPKPVELSLGRQKIVTATAELILEAGVQALTHREIARRSSASLSSLTYHFVSLAELTRCGFEQLFTPGRPADPVAAYGLALQALRDPALRPLAVNVRWRLAGSEGDEDPQGLALSQDQALTRMAEALTGSVR